MVVGKVVAQAGPHLLIDRGPPPEVHESFLSIADPP